MNAPDHKLLVTLQGLTQFVEEHAKHPYGPEADPDLRQLAGGSCLELCGGDPDTARTLWKLVTADMGGYMPVAAAKALLRASATDNLVPDVQAPEL